MKKEVEYRTQSNQHKQDNLSEDFGNEKGSTLQLVTKYNSCLTKLQDRHALLKKRAIIVKAGQSWLNESLRLQRTNLHRLEWKWQKNHYEHDMKFLKQERKIYLDSLAAAKQ